MASGAIGDVIRVRQGNGGVVRSVTGWPRGRQFLAGKW